MSFDVRPTDISGTYDASGRVVPAPADEVDEGRFARVYELAERSIPVVTRAMSSRPIRRRRTPRCG